jgi:hypothetical protein
LRANGRKKAPDAIRVLDPAESDETPSRPQTPDPAPRLRWPQLTVLVVAGVAALLVAGQLAQPVESAPFAPLTVAAPDPGMVAPEPPPPPPPPPSPRAIIAANPIESQAVLVFEKFVTMVNRGDSRAVLELMLPELPDVVGIGTAEYPHLPTDAGLWSDGVLDEDEVEGFVRYVFTLPGSVFVSDCEAWGDGPRVTIVVCHYITSGGVLSALGQKPEGGRLYGVIAEGKVAGTFRRGGVDLDLWEQFTEWTALHHPDRLLQTLGRIDQTPVLDPEYSGDSALEHGALAAEMAEALAEEDGAAAG